MLVLFFVVFQKATPKGRICMQSKHLRKHGNYRSRIDRKLDIYELVVVVFALCIEKCRASILHKASST